LSLKRTSLPEAKRAKRPFLFFLYYNGCESIFRVAAAFSGACFYSGKIMQIKKLFAVTVFSVFASLCQAAAPSEASIETLLDITKAKSIVEKMPATMEQTMRLVLREVTADQNLSPEQKRALDATAQKFMQIISEEFSWETLKPSYIQIYMETFTQEEIDGLIAFYRTPTGHALIEKMPLVIQKSTALGLEKVKPLMQKFNEAIRQTLTEQKK
jgi:hypothetical protein